MNSSPEVFESYKHLLGSEVVDQLFEIADLLKGVQIVHINSTKEGGGVAEILAKMVPLSNALGIDTRWEIIEGNEIFYECTKMFHNLLQGKAGAPPSASHFRAYEEVNQQNREKLSALLQHADIVFIHDPQPLPLITHFPERKGKWIWRCHIEMSRPARGVWNYLKRYASLYDASIFSLEDFVKPLPHPIYLIPPSIDPFSDKNIELEESEIEAVFREHKIDRKRPVALQVSRYDRFKDPIGVVEAYRMAKRFQPDLQLVFAGGGASDDPEGAEVLKELQLAASDDPDIHTLLLPSNAHRAINALQRGADLILQKSIKEGFGLTVTEALWKGKPVIGGNTGGIRLQVINHHTGFLVNTPEGAALRMRYLLHNPETAKELGGKGRRLVKENFLITRHLREYLTTATTLLSPNGDRINLERKR